MSKMLGGIILFLGLLALAGCAPNDGGIDAFATPTLTPFVTPTPVDRAPVVITLPPTPVPTVTPQPTPTPQPIVTASPAPTPQIIGPLKVSINASLFDLTIDVSVLNFLAGDTAAARIKQAFGPALQVAYEEPGSGEEYVLVHFKLTLVNGPPGEVMTVDSIRNFEMAQIDGTPAGYVYLPESLDFPERVVKRGDSIEGWVGGIVNRGSHILVGYRDSELDDLTVFTFNCLDIQHRDVVNVCFGPDLQRDSSRPDAVAPSGTPKPISVSESPEFKALGSIVNSEFGVITQQLAATTRHALGSNLKLAANSMNLAVVSCFTALDAIGAMDELSPDPVWSVIWVHIMSYCSELDSVYRHLLAENGEEADAAMGRANEALQQAMPLVPPGSW